MKFVFAKVFLPVFLFLLLSYPVLATTSGNISEIPGEVRVQLLAREFLDNLDPVKMKMVLSDVPDKEGRVNHLYLDIYRPLIGGVRIDKLQVEAYDIKFTPPSTWKDGPVEIEEILHVKAWGKLDEADINNSLIQKEFGEDEHWHDLHLDFGEEGLLARGYYLAQVLMLRFDILIEISGNLAIVDKQQIWLDNYKVKINRVGLPEGLTERAISRIQPILDLSKFIFPLRLHSVEMDDNSVILRSRVLPEDFNGIAYYYEPPGTEK